MPRRVFPLLLLSSSAWGDFHARSRFALSTVPEEKWGTTRSLDVLHIPGLNYIKANNTFLNSLRKDDVEAQVEFTLKVMERAKVTCYWYNS